MSKRFGPWYYVIDAGSFEELRPSRDDLVRKIEKEGDDGGAEDNGGDGGDDGDK